MTAVQPTSNRRSFFGRDALSRMLDMEKRSQMQRAPDSLSRPPLQAPASTNQLPTLPSPKQPNNAGNRGSADIPPPTLRASTTPNIKIDLTKAKKVNFSVEAIDDMPSPICHSPTWSIRGEEAQKKVEAQLAKDKKGLEKKVKRDEDKKRFTMAKSNKRLSKKPPPAAMDTQRMPAALGRPSTSLTSQSAASSVNNSRSSSKERRRSSISSLASIIRSPMPFLTRRGSSSHTKFPSDKHHDLQTYLDQPCKNRTKRSPSLTPKTSDEDEAYVMDLTDFAYQIEGVTQTGEEKDFKHLRPECSGRESTHSSPLDTPPPSRSKDHRLSTEAAIEKIGTQKTWIEANARQKEQRVGRRDNTGGGYQYPATSRSSLDSATKRYSRDGIPKHTQISYAAHQSLSSPALIDTPKSPPQSESYVRKQRRHQQQRSISGYEDEMAIIQALKTSQGVHSMPPTPDESTESLNNARENIRKGLKEDIEAQGSPANSVSGRYHTYLAQQSQTQRTSPTKHEHSQSSLSKVERANGPRPGVNTRHVPRATSDDPPRMIEASKALPSGPKPHVASSEPSKLSKETEKVAGKMMEYPQNKTVCGSHNAFTDTKSEESRKSSPKSRSSLLLPPNFKMPMFSRSSTTPDTTLVGAEDVSSEKSFILAKTPSKDIISKTQPFEQHKKPRNNMKDPVQEFIIQGVDGDGLVRKTSIKRPRSDPEMKVVGNEVKSSFLDFLPELKHQPLVKPKRSSMAKSANLVGPVEVHVNPSTSQFPVPASVMDFTPPPLSSEILTLPNPPFAPSGSGSSSPTLRRQGGIKANRTSFGSSQTLPSDRLHMGQTANAKPIAKMFVICCKCKYWHDLPSRLYEAMALPRAITDEDGVSRSLGARNLLHQESKTSKAGMGVEGKIFTTVECPWCEHSMSTYCCAGWTSIVYLHERHH